MSAVAVRLAQGNVAPDAARFGASKITPAIIAAQQCGNFASVIA